MAKKQEMITLYPVEEAALLLLERKMRWGTCAICFILISRILATLVTQSMFYNGDPMEVSWLRVPLSESPHTAG